VTAVLAVAATLLWWEHKEISWLFMDAQTWQGQIWRPFTSIFLHVNAIHLIFNLYWLWVFGSLVEKTYGHLAYLGILALLAFSSSTAEYAFAVPGVGMSGVSYGLFGLLWVLSRRDERFHGAVDAQTIILYVAWFFLCIFLTHSGAWQVGNVAHAVGALQGIALGLTLAFPSWRIPFAALTVLVAVTALLAATLGQPDLNFSEEGREIYAQWKAHEAYQRQLAGDHERAVNLYREALAITPNDAASWYNWASRTST
jgi:membrane associated rhomboid family serine protease